jgi:2',3'-cyclic-nucleotide 2'-phosphodiesterase (5'-nucleotidase family)
LARRATFIHQLRNANPYVLLIDAGNALTTDQALTSATKGAAMIEGMNRLGYDVMTLGDQDFRWGPSILRERMSEAQFPFLSANVYAGSAQNLFAQPYVIKEMAGHRIAIIGVTSKTLVSFLPQGGSEPVMVSDSIEAVQRIISDLQSQADIFIVCSNLGFAQDQQLAAQVAGIALIVGGNPGTLMPEPYRDLTHGTLIVQAGYQGEWIGQMNLQITATGEVASYQGQTVLLGADFADDPGIRSWLNSPAAQQ